MVYSDDIRLKKLKNTFKIFVTEEGYPEEEITDLFWFEENGVHWFDGYGLNRRYNFRIEIIQETVDDIEYIYSITTNINKSGK